MTVMGSRNLSPLTKCTATLLAEFAEPDDDGRLRTALTRQQLAELLGQNTRGISERMTGRIDELVLEGLVTRTGRKGGPGSYALHAADDAPPAHVRQSNPETVRVVQEMLARQAAKEAQEVRQRETPLERETRLALEREQRLTQVQS